MVAVMIEFFDGVLAVWIICFQMNKGDVSLLGLGITGYYNEIPIGNIGFHAVPAYFNEQEALRITESRADMNSVFYG